MPIYLRIQLHFTFIELLKLTTEKPLITRRKMWTFGPVLKNHAFDIEEGSISLKPAQGFSVTDILPPDYKVEAGTSTVPPPLSRKCLQSDYFNGYYKKMFDASHLQVIHAIYFGPVEV
jgi:hypothetical protein